MRVVVPKEIKDGEKRVALVPDVINKLTRLGFDVVIESGAGTHSQALDAEYEAAGAMISDGEVLSAADAVLSVQPLTPAQMSKLKKGAITISFLSPVTAVDSIDAAATAGVTAFSLELVPRISRAQSMDALTSQALCAGYRAVLVGAELSPRFFPLLMTAAGTVTPAQVLVLGAGVAGLQAIATAKRMGAIVFATDVRMASKEQVESLGGKFLTVEGAENLETEGGYAKEASDDFKKKQEELLSETLKKIDIVICTALIPGKKAPVIIKEDMINNMGSGSIIYDLAAIQGGNTAHTKVDEIVYSNGVKIMGESNILNKLPTSASNLYAKNVFNFVSNLYDKENNKININLEDEIIEKTLIK